MQTAVIKRSIVLDGHKTSVSLENEFWYALREIAARENTALSAIRVHVFNYFRAQFEKLESGQPHLDADVLLVRQEMAS